MKKNYLISTFIFLFCTLPIFTNSVTAKVYVDIDSPTFQQVAPIHWEVYKSSKKISYSKDEYEKSVNYFRENNQLPDTHDWLDQRKEVEYPLVYAPKNIVCSYNPHLDYCEKPQHKKEVPTTQPPNVAFIVVESFSPSPMFIEDSVVTSSKKIMDGPLYKEMYLPNLRSISQ